MNRKKLFIIEDDPMFAEMLQDRLKDRPLWDVAHYATGEEAIKNGFREPDVAIIDYHLDLNNKGGLSGIDTMTHLLKDSPNTHCIFLSDQKSYGLALQTISHGALNYVMKDENAFDEIIRILDSIQ